MVRYRTTCHGEVSNDPERVEARLAKPLDQLGVVRYLTMTKKRYVTMTKSNEGRRKLLLFFAFVLARSNHVSW